VVRSGTDKVRRPALEDECGDLSHGLTATSGNRQPAARVPASAQGSSVQGVPCALDKLRRFPYAYRHSVRKRSGQRSQGCVGHTHTHTHFACLTGG